MIGWRSEEGGGGGELEMIGNSVVSLIERQIDGRRIKESERERVTE